MKTKLLLLSLLSAGTYAQSTIGSYYSVNNTVNFIATSAVPLDESDAGEDAEWTFDQLTLVGNSVVTNYEPTAEELELYPNTTTVTMVTVVDEEDAGFLYTENDENTVSITGAVTTDLDVNYDVDNATIGVFPMEYGYTYTDDTVAGHFTAGEYSGTFEGTSTTSVDAYGTLTAGTMDSVGEPVNVTRLKTVQALTLSYLDNEVGTLTQTTYSYYLDEMDMGSPIFRSTSTTTVVPSLDIDQTDTSLEAFLTVLLGTPSLSQSKTGISPNPAQDFLNFKVANGAQIHSVNFKDINGRNIKTISSPGNTVDVSDLESGMYFAEITTDKETSVQKIIKK